VKHVLCLLKTLISKLLIAMFLEQLWGEPVTGRINCGLSLAGRI